jgi:predicted transcriptional regulator
MKTFTFKYVPSEPSISKVVKSAASGKPQNRPNELVSTNLKTLLQLASEARLEIFNGILKYKPNSVYELAEKLGKSQPYILKEVRTLESLGLVRLVREIDGNRERLKPVALYSQIIISCDFEAKASGF